MRERSSNGAGHLVFLLCGFYELYTCSHLSKFYWILSSSPRNASKSDEICRIEAHILSVIHPYSPVGFGFGISTLVPPVIINRTSKGSRT